MDSKEIVNRVFDITDRRAKKILALIMERVEAKKNRNFSRADEIRNELLELSIEIRDTANGIDIIDRGA